VDAGLSVEARRAGVKEGLLNREEVREIAVGAAAVLLFAAILMLSYIGFAGGAASSSYRIYATFNRIDGLVIGDNVQLSGIPVGEVAEMTLGPNYRARVGLDIDRRVTLPVDSSAAIHTDGLFGRKFVVLEPGGADEALTDKGVITFTQDALIVSELLDLVIAEGRAQRVRSAAEPP
jgi:phospholipid/cholesterol/gamma-HCH transport system substrate-binding protein